MSDERQTTDEQDNDPKLDREEIKDLTPPADAADAVRGGRRADPDESGE